MKQTEIRKRTTSLEWKKLIKKIIERDEDKCRKCGQIGNLTVHHIVPYKISKDDSAKNLITLCKRCHAKEENKYRRIGMTHYVRQMILENITKNL